MRKLLLLSALLVFACSSDDSNDNSSSELFRELYQGTSWYDEDSGGLYAFSPSRLLTFETTGGNCFYWEEGTIDASEIDTDGCFYDIISYTVLEEDREKFSFTADFSDGVPVGGPGNCAGGAETLTFRVISENSIELNDGFDVFILSKTNTDFNLNSCANGTLVGYPLPW